MGLGEAMVAARRIIALSVDADQRRELVDIARSRTEPANRVERAGIILAYLNEPSAYAVARTMGVSQPTVTRCLERAAEFGVLAALDDRARTGREATITAEARTWLVGLACAKPKQFGYPHELWTTRLLAAHARDHGPGAGHPSLAHLAQGTVCKILAAHDVKPHKVRYYLERRDPEFEPKMAEVLCVYREVAMRRAAGGAGEAAIAVVSYDEKPGIQAIGTTAPDLPPVPAAHPTIARDHEYKRHGTVTLMAGIDLLTGQVHALVRDRHRRREFIEFLGFLDMAYPAATTIKIILDNTPRIFLEKPRLGSRPDPKGASSSSSPPSTDRGLTSSRASLPKPPAPYSVTSASPPSTSSSNAFSNSSTTSTATQ
jgi:transposase